MFMYYCLYNNFLLYVVSMKVINVYILYAFVE
jgi:hypothetical protein